MLNFFSGLKNLLSGATPLLVIIGMAMIALSMRGCALHLKEQEQERERIVQERMQLVEAREKNQQLVKQIDTLKRELDFAKDKYRTVNTHLQEQIKLNEAAKQDIISIKTSAAKHQVKNTTSAKKVTVPTDVKQKEQLYSDVITALNNFYVELEPHAKHATTPSLNTV